MRERLFLVIAIFGVAMVVSILLDAHTHTAYTSPGGAEEIELKRPLQDGSISVERAIQERRSVRSFRPDPLTTAQASQLLWAAQGITDPEQGRRTVPSAGALYPLEIYMVAGRVECLSPGLYHYVPQGHKLSKVRDGDFREALSDAAYAQESLKEAPAVMLLAGVYERTSGKYGERAQRFVHIEAGHAGQNLALQAIAMGLSTVMVGGFVDDQVKKALNLPDDVQPLYLIPVGTKK